MAKDTPEFIRPVGGQEPEDFILQFLLPSFGVHPGRKDKNGENFGIR